MAQIQALYRKIAKGGWSLEFTDRQLAGLLLVGLPEKYDVAVEFLGKEEALWTELVKTRLLREVRAATEQRGANHIQGVNVEGEARTACLERRR